MLAVEELHAKAAGGRPMLVFNGELDRIRSGYYPAFFYPINWEVRQELPARLRPDVSIHDFKGAKGGVLFRAYPGPWQVGGERKEG